MANVSVTQALQAAERLRLQFAALQFADLAITPTVSVGVAMASEAGRRGYGSASSKQAGPLHHSSA
jgi:GGDEF domain-containing protein